MTLYALYKGTPVILAEILPKYFSKIFCSYLKLSLQNKVETIKLAKFQSLEHIAVTKLFLNFCFVLFLLFF